MRLNTLKPAKGAVQNAKRVGRGIGCGLGKTCGLGHKGQTARTGYGQKKGFEGGQMPLQRRLPKFGFKSKIDMITGEVPLCKLAKVDADVIDIAALKKSNLINANIKKAKVMLSGELSKSVTLRGIKVTAGARKAIEAAGGKIE